MRAARTVANVLAACTDSNRLSKLGYTYLCGCSGFIAHRSLGGFRSYYYRNPGRLVADLLAHKADNARVTGYPKEHPDYAYYEQRAQIYAKITNRIESALREE